MCLGLLFRSQLREHAFARDWQPHSQNRTVFSLGNEQLLPVGILIRSIRCAHAGARPDAIYRLAQRTEYSCGAKSGDDDREVSGLIHRLAQVTCHPREVSTRLRITR
jgi:hypothetical protein